MRLSPLLAVVAMLCLPVSGAFAQDGLQVADARLGRGVQDREITEEAASFAVNERAYLWLRLTGGPADPITVTWKSGDHEDSVSFKVDGSPWRTWSSKTLWKAGDWSVTVSDAAGQVLKEVAFTVE